MSRRMAEQAHQKTSRYDARRTPEGALRWHVNLLMVEVARLKERVADLEKTAYSVRSEFVEGWTRAGELIGVSEKTCKRRAKLGQFPRPCRTIILERANGKDHERPAWRRADLVAYAEGKMRERYT